MVGSSSHLYLFSYTLLTWNAGITQILSLIQGTLRGLPLQDHPKQSNQYTHLL